MGLLYRFPLPPASLARFKYFFARLPLLTHKTGPVPPYPLVQVIHGTATLGKPKVDSARDRMLDVNPHIKVEAFHEQLTSENALRICDGYDVVRLPTTKNTAVDSLQNSCATRGPSLLEWAHESSTASLAISITDQLWQAQPPSQLKVLRGLNFPQVLDGSDNFPTKYLVNDACEILGIPNVYGAILGFEGQMSVFTYKVSEPAAGAPS